jgi:hypothetical protein
MHPCGPRSNERGLFSWPSPMYIWRQSNGDVMPKSHTVFRDNRTGQFVTVREADRNPKTTVKERVPAPGYGDTGRDASSGRFLSQEPVTKRGNISDADARRAVDVYRSGKK